MIFFAVYAALVWFAAARWRRQWQSFAWLLVGVLGLIVTAWLHLLLNEWTGGRIFLPVLQALLYPYAAFVATIGLYIACMPRARTANACASCEYDLSGLEHEGLVCPECGIPAVSPAPRARPRRPAAPEPVFRLPGASAAPSACLDPAVE